MPSHLLPVLLAAALAAASPDAHAQPGVTVRPDMRAHFAAEGVTGTFVLYDLAEDAFVVSDTAGMDTPHLPASTFKIPHTLIALELGAVAPGERMAWDGVQRSVAAWNRDHDLASAFAHSVVWYYQAVARRIGPERMAEAVARLGYGNAAVGPAVDRFWLDGDLRITPREQALFLARLARGELDADPAAAAVLRDIMVLERTDAHVLRGKTGWAVRPGPDVGWFVGSVERGGRTWTFACYVDLEEDADAAARRRAAEGILRALGLLEG